MCVSSCSLQIWNISFTSTSVNRFAGTRLEDLQAEIPSLCKDQHGCRYLQKKLEENVPEHRDMIFRETFGHFAELMTGLVHFFSVAKTAAHTYLVIDPFGNYLCQKLLEYSSEEQRNVICHPVAKKPISFSPARVPCMLREKLIDFLSS